MPEDLPRVSLLGRPNVGKSTLFNRLIRSNRAITHDMPGVTRDRMEGLARRAGERSFVIIDTGGITLDAHETVSEGPAGIRGFEAEILRQAEDAMAESSVLCLVVDAREGLTPFDEHLSAFIRRAGKPAIVAVNKVDGAENADTLLAEFYSLGLPLVPCSAAHGFNVRELEEQLRDLLPPEEERFDDEEDEDGAGKDADMSSIRIAMLGRPNAGKSSLVNALSGLSRMIVSDVAGTTRDSVDVSVTMDGVTYTFVDTAGVRRPARITDTVEKYSVNSSLKSTTKAHVTLLVLDGPGGLTQQDKRLIELLSERMTAFMVLVNKSDLIPPATMKALERDFKDALAFCPHVPLLFVSALKGKNLKKILPLALSLRKECSRRVPTGALNRAFEDILQRHQPPIVKQARAKFYYMTQAESEPPTFVFFVNDADRVLASYARYIEKSLRREFGITHAPVRVRFRSTHTKKSKK
ncbi:ribosome biogenesis GTPase Der [Desulfovibrio sp. OttesenSCG-928-I05]|nr:ribosome biogenesis GTPase Der [Desulfovibrio sp. OttesenSCG-928-I05]